jgi:hypothetical protein
MVNIVIRLMLSSHNVTFSSAYSITQEQELIVSTAITKNYKFLRTEIDNLVLKVKSTLGIENKKTDKSDKSDKSDKLNKLS